MSSAVRTTVGRVRWFGVGHTTFLLCDDGDVSTRMCVFFFARCKWSQRGRRCRRCRRCSASQWRTTRQFRVRTWAWVAVAAAASGEIEQKWRQSALSSCLSQTIIIRAKKKRNTRANRRKCWLRNEQQATPISRRPSRVTPIEWMDK